MELLRPWADSVWDVGIRFGTVGARHRDQTWEITTYRTDTYEDASRKPDVVFGRSLAADLLRRDFTINAMALSDSGQEIRRPIRWAGRRGGAGDPDTGDTGELVQR